MTRQDIIVAPGCFDPLSAKVVERLNFKAAYLGGYAVGAHLCIPEPLLTSAEIAMVARYVTSAVDIPVIVDAGAGYGDAVHTARTVHRLENAGVAALHIEDQLYPKRMHYHRGVEHVIPVDEMVGKIKAAVDARRGEDLVIIARTDTLRTHGQEEAIARANRYFETGADMVMFFPRNIEEAEVVANSTRVPLVYVNSEGMGRPVLAPKLLEEMGYRMVVGATEAILVAFSCLWDLFATLKKAGIGSRSKDEMTAVRSKLEDLIGFPELLELEEETTERIQ